MDTPSSPLSRPTTPIIPSLSPKKRASRDDRLRIHTLRDIGLSHAEIVAKTRLPLSTIKYAYYHLITNTNLYRFNKNENDIDLPPRI